MRELIKNLKYKLQWLKIYRSPFKRPKVAFYFGKIKQGTPYFLPRKWVNNKEKEGYLKPVPVKWLWIDIVGLGWKDKFNSPRHEWNPMISIVFLGLQFTATFYLEDSRCWESYLAYEHYTPETFNKYEKLMTIVEEHPNIWVSYEMGVKTKTDYLKASLKPIWIKFLYEQDEETR